MAGADERVSKRGLLKRLLFPTALSVSSAQASEAIQSGRDIDSGIAGILAASFGAVGDGRVDDTAALSRGIEFAVGAKSQLVLQGGATYRVDGTLPVYDGTRVCGSSSRQGFCTFRKMGYGPLFESANTSEYLSGVLFSDFEAMHGTNAPGNAGEDSCFRLNSPTNNSSFQRLLIRNFPGSGFEIGRQTGNQLDRTGPGNCVFEQIFVTSCGQYAFDIDGFINAIFLMNDWNSCGAGGMRLRSGVSNQAEIGVFGLWWEGNRPWTGKHVFRFDDAHGQVLNLFSSTFQNCCNTKGSLVDHSGTNAPPRVNLYGCAAFGFEYIISQNGLGSRPFTDADRGIVSLGSAISAERMALRGTKPHISLSDDGPDGKNYGQFRITVRDGELIISFVDGCCLNKDIVNKPASLRMDQNTLIMDCNFASTNIERAPGMPFPLQLPIFDRQGRRLGAIPIYRDP